MTTNNLMNNTDHHELANENAQELVFSKIKMLGKLTYKRTKTTVQIDEENLNIHKVTKKIFRKEITEEKVIARAAIASAQSRTVMDFWDTLYTVIFVLFGIFAPQFFLLAAVCFWCAYGKEIRIIMANGEIFTIPVAHGKKEIAELLVICNSKT